MSDNIARFNIVPVLKAIEEQLMNMKKIFTAFGILVIAFGSVACDNNTNVSDSPVVTNVTADSFSVRVGILESNNQLFVRIPLGVFGEEDADVSGASISMYRNGALILANIDAATFYVSQNQEVGFLTSPWNDGDEIGIAVNSNRFGDIYYEGTVSDSSESQAILGVLTPNITPVLGAMESFFVEKQTQTGDAEGSDFSGDYDSDIIVKYSQDCTLEFVKGSGFVTGTSDDDILDILNNGNLFYRQITVEQTDGSITWNFGIGSILNGVIDSDGSFEIFDGDYVDEKNYSYTLISGTIDAEDSSISADWTEVLVLDGTQLLNGLQGSCTSTAYIDTLIY